MTTLKGQDRTDAVCIIGAGPAGLATARALRARGLDYDQFERHSDVGGLWDIDAPGSPMYEAAHFISSRTMSGFAGFPMSDSFPDYPSHRQVLSYIRDFATAYDLRNRITFNAPVQSVTKLDDGTWLVDRGHGEAARYRAVVCCSGAQWTPNLPPVPGSFSGEVLHSSEYRDLDQISGKRVLVVGGGNSACDIVVDAGRAAAGAVISMRRGYWFIPKHVFGVPSDVFADSGPQLPTWVQQRLFGTLLNVLYGKPEKLGLQRPEHKLFETHPVLNSNLFLSLQHGDVTAKPGITTTSGSTVAFADGSSADFDMIIMATGYLHTVPYAQPYFSSAQHPELYLTSFSREHQGLFGVGFVETNSGAYQHFDGSAQMIASYLDDQRRRPDQARRFAAMIAADRPDLTGGITFDKSPRHQGYVDAHALSHYRDGVFRKMGWQLLESPIHRSPADEAASLSASSVQR
ncbi:MAG: NAD(P)-binding domain-containing protein [Nakamurella sp.]